MFSFIRWSWRLFPTIETLTKTTSKTKQNMKLSFWYRGNGVWGGGEAGEEYDQNLLYKIFLKNK